jgi:hypothetical protein
MVIDEKVCLLIFSFVFSIGCPVHRLASKSEKISKNIENVEKYYGILLVEF